MAFLKKSQNRIRMADGSLQLIDDIVSGDWLQDRDAFPTHVRVISNLLTERLEMIKINDEISVSSDQVFLGADGLFYVFGGTSNRFYQYNNGGMKPTLFYNNTISVRPFVLVPDDMVKPLEIGTVLAGEAGNITVTSIEPIVLEDIVFTKSFFDLYKKDKSEVDITTLNYMDYVTDRNVAIQLSVHRTGIFCVNGYKCLGLPNNDWDYVNDVLEEENSYEIDRDSTGKLFKVRD
jgi:hypothetical protein